MQSFIFYLSKKGNVDLGLLTYTKYNRYNILDWEYATGPIDLNESTELLWYTQNTGWYLKKLVYLFINVSIYVFIYLFINVLVQYTPQASVQIYLLFVYVLMLVCVVCCVGRGYAILLYFKCNGDKGNSFNSVIKYLFIKRANSSKGWSKFYNNSKLFCLF